MLLGFGLVIRLALLLFGTGPLVSDALYYDGIANAIVAGHDYEPYWPPGLTYYLAAWKSVFGLEPIVSRLAMLPWYLGLVFVARDILRRISGHLPANLAVAMLGFYPALIHHSIEPLSQLPAATLLLLAFHQYLRFRETPEHLTVHLSGLFLGMLVLFRPSALILVAVWPLIIGWRRRSFLQAWIPVLFVVGLTSWGLTQRHGRFVLLNDANARNLYLGNTPWTDTYKTWYYGSHWTMSPANPDRLRLELETIRRMPVEERSNAFLKKALQHIGDDPVGFGVRTASRVRTFWAADSFSGARLVNQGQKTMGYTVLGLDGVFYLLVMALALWWWFAVGWPQAPGFRIAIGGLVALYALPYTFSFSHPTYHQPVLPLLVVMASLGCASLWTSKVKLKIHRKWVAAMVILLLIQLEWVIRMGQS